jgi:Cu2+-exporting ATPase
MSVEGMTCNDCASKLESSLKILDGTSDVRVNFIRGRADLHYDPTITNVEDLIGKARTATGFNITEVRQGAQGSLDLLVENHAAALESLRVDGLLDVKPLNKSTVRVNYDPNVIGARDLVRRIGPLSTGLAPAVPESNGEGRGQFQMLSVYTALATALTLPVVILAWAEDLVSHKTQAIISLPLATAVQLLAVPVFYKPALRSLILHHALELDMLVVVSITAAFSYSLVAFGFRMKDQPLDTGEFFETSTLLITLVMMGRLLASYARIRAVAAVSLRAHHAATAVLIHEGTDEDVEIDARLLQYGDVLKVHPHSRVPTDGVVIKGISEVDESMLTGESLPVPKEVGSDVIAGTMNHSGVLVMKLTRLPGDNTVMDIARLVEDATNSKPRIQDLADRVAGYFLPVVGIATTICLVIWIAIGLKVRNYSTGRAVSNAVTYAIAVLAVSCPCALGLAVPMVLVVAGGIAAKGGVIIKSAESTERARKVTDVVFDKTGTITEPGLDVIAEEYLDANKDEAYAIARQLVSGSSHPISVAVLRHIEQSPFNDTNQVAVENTKSIPGAGVEANYGTHTVRAGNPAWTGHAENDSVRRLSGQGLSILTITRDGQLLAVFGLKNRIRSTAGRIISQLKDSGITVHLVSGDHPQAVDAVAQEVGINPARAVGSYTPEQKRNYVASLMDEGRYVLFCGDGTNDAVAVAQANVGVQISEAGSASAVTQSAADVILLSGLSGLPLLLDISRAAFRRIVFNFAWSAIYNVLAILLAGGAFVKIRIAPAYAGAGEMVSIMPVIVAAMTMLLVKLKP